MKTIPSLKTLFAPIGLAAVLAMGAASAAWAANATAAGTVVSNTISLSYDGATNGGTTERIALPATAQHTETFKVARKIDLTLVADQSGQELRVNPAQTTATIEFTLTNRGNPNESAAAQGFNITVAATGSIVDGSNALTYSTTQTNTLGQYYVTVGGTVTDVNNTNSDVSLASNGTSTIRIIANIPSGATDGLADIFTVTAVAVDSGTAVAQSRSADLDVVSVVFADAASTSNLSGGPLTLDAALNGQAKTLKLLESYRRFCPLLFRQMSWGILARSIEKPFQLIFSGHHFFIAAFAPGFDQFKVGPIDTRSHTSKPVFESGLIQSCESVVEVDIEIRLLHAMVRPSLAGSPLLTR